MTMKGTEKGSGRAGRAQNEGDPRSDGEPRPGCLLRDRRGERGGGRCRHGRARPRANSGAGDVGYAIEDLGRLEERIQVRRRRIAVHFARSPLDSLRTATCNSARPFRSRA